MVAIKNIWSRHVSGSYKTVCLHLIFDNLTRVYKFFAFSFPFFFQKPVSHQLATFVEISVAKINIFFSCHGNQNGCNLELCNDPLWVWVGSLEVNQVVFLARHFTPCRLLIQSFQSQCIRIVFLIFLKFFSFCHFVIMIHQWKLKRNYILGWLRLNYQLLFRNMSPYSPDTREWQNQT